MDITPNVPIVADIMLQFAKNTGLTGDGKPRRYLWTDAFAVCNFLGLHDRTGDGRFLDLARHLVDQVHLLLGRHRDDDPRSGWISGLSEEEGAAHPTAGGLRIGKPLPERNAGEDFDRQLEWDRDGQYFHYLTKWMQALHQVAAKTGEESYDRWARELAVAAHRGFVHHFGQEMPPRMYWKMSIDLSFPQVSGMGHHDPLDGYVILLALRAAAPGELQRQTAEMAELCRGRDWTTDDPLGIGNILDASLRLTRLAAAGAGIPDGLVAELLVAAAEGLRQYSRHNPARLPTDQRLAFRELGLAIGLHALGLVESSLRGRSPGFGQAEAITAALNRLMPYRELATTIPSFWLEKENQRNSSWLSHLDINMVMLATSLLPQGFLG